ncbi:hypothetical protein KTR66_03125 [Roseococcus sp. SDR]|uniref:hypothetical protein n=1 Tax=Roseococcus sp. SDR TaxID=2835532 RepID=UPI001BD12A37|nr:hypothetical protein [Roseococcus sp. SDR]MBS7788969.1 hypothetical protein [Roseococcus sp. SDR]MBV1844283.1 hypothetical protein [Roseococcus sp. SDR]
MTTMFCVGNSHLAAVAKGASIADIPVLALAMRHKLAKHKEGELGEAFWAKISEEVATRKPTRIFAFIGGGTPAMLGLLRHSEPFDFVLPDAPTLPLSEGSTVLPYDAVRAIASAHMRRHFRRLNRLAALGVPVVQCETPPPVPDNGFLARHVAQTHPEVDVASISPPAMRYKIWRLHSQLFEQFCKSRQIGYARNPPEVADADGFLKQEYWGDIVHGNARYGAAVLRQLKELA